MRNVLSMKRWLKIRSKFTKRRKPVLNAKNVAEYFLSIVDVDNGDSLSNLKIQKLLYYSQGFSLAIFRGVIFPEKIVAWNLGPVVVEIYEEYSKYGNGPVPLPEDFDLTIYPDAEKELLDEVFSVYGQFSAGALVEMTHDEPPWRNTKPNNEISLKHMQDFFSKQLK